MADNNIEPPGTRRLLIQPLAGLNIDTGGMGGMLLLMIVRLIIHSIKVIVKMFILQYLSCCLLVLKVFAVG